MCADCEVEFDEFMTAHEKTCSGDCKICQAVKEEKELGIYNVGPAERAFILGL